ncbi:beta-phosphoglucomutase [Planctomycetota bacterium]|nr:beta-phosphoglucomutase [Planctomycetota bacterium]
MKYQAVIFDLDGVITDTAKFHYLGWKKLADELGVTFNEEMNEDLKGVSRMGSLEYLLERGNVDMPEVEKLVVANKKNDFYIQMLEEQMDKSDILDGVVVLLKELRNSGVKTAIASASKNATFVLRKLGLLESFDYIVDAAAVEHPKPHPETFLAAAEGIGVLPGKCIAVEDAQVGVQAIKAAGMFAVGVGDTEILKEADLNISCMAEFQNILNEMNEVAV